VTSPSSIPAASFRDDLVALMPRLRRFCLSLAGSVDAGDDLMQAVLERALIKQDLYQPGTRLDHWLLRLARNLNIDRIRAEQSRGGPGESLELAENVVGSHGVDVVESRSDLAQAGQAFLALPDTHRSVFALVVLEGLSYREASEVLEVPIGTVMSRIARARIMLERAVGGGHDDG